MTVSLARRSASVDLRAQKGSGLKGDLSGPRPREQVTKSIAQFGHVRRVVIAINGNPRFDDLRGD